jgi:hypothetical protein
MLDYLRTQLRGLAEQRAAAFAAMGEALKTAQAENRAPTDPESAAFTEARGRVTALDDQIAAMSEQIKGLEDDEKRGAAAASILAAAGQTGQQRSGGAVVASEPMTYARGNGQSYFLDMARAQVRNDAEARSRLERHAAELRVELPKREARRDSQAEREVRTIGGVDERAAESAFERRTNPNRTDGQGGRVAVLCG